LQQESLLAVEADPRTLARRAVHPHISHTLEPELPLLIEIRIVEKGAERQVMRSNRGASAALPDVQWGPSTPTLT